MRRSVKYRVTTAAGRVNNRLTRAALRRGWDGTAVALPDDDPIGLAPNRGA